VCAQGEGIKVKDIMQKRSLLGRNTLLRRGFFAFLAGQVSSRQPAPARILLSTRTRPNPPRCLPPATYLASQKSLCGGEWGRNVILIQGPTWRLVLTILIWLKKTLIVQFIYHIFNITLSTFNQIPWEISFSLARY
jgi:hypothetical protein